MVFTREHLTGSGYDWQPAGPSQREPTRRRFDRFNGNSMLHMLNLFSTLVTDLDIHDGQRMEALIASELPLAETNEIAVFNWLKKRFIYPVATRPAN